METSKIIAHPKLAAIIINLQMEHALPVEIIRGGKDKEGNVELTLKYELEDHNAYAWLINKGTIIGCKEIQEEGVS